MRTATVGAVAVLALLTGCSEAAGVGVRQPVAESALPTAAPVPVSAKLAEQKKAAGIADCPASDPSTPVVQRGLPDVVLPCLGGGREVHLAGLRGRPMMINVWAQWCGPCRAEAPFLSEVAANGRGAVMILGVDYVDGVQPERAVEFARVAGWTYPQLADPDKQLAAPLQIAGPPQTFFVRADGTIAHRHSGPFTSAEQIRQLTRRHLGVDL